MELANMLWSPGQFSESDLDYEDADFAVFLMQKNKAEVVWNIVATFENIPASLPDTSEILAGRSVANLKIFDLLKIKHYGDAIDVLCDMVKHGEFDLSKETACKLHSVAAKDEVIERGIFRTRNVSLQNVTYSPPDPVTLQNIWDDGMGAISRIDNPLERACATFLFMSRSQFFYDCNKRTATLMLNGELMKSGIKPFFIPRDTKNEFAEKLAKIGRAHV
jgi:Fic family protein